MDAAAEVSTGEPQQASSGDEPATPARKAGFRLLPVGDYFVDTTGSSPLHKIAGDQPGSSFLIIKAYVLAVALTYLPLTIAAFLGPVSVFAPSATVRLPFLYDWNIAFAFLVTFPCVVAFTVSDHVALASALFRIQRDGILVISDADAQALSIKWTRRFRTVNRAGFIAGAAEGCLLVVFNYIAYSTPGVGFWVSITSDHRSLMVASVFMYCIFALYSSTLFYIFRSVAITLFLNDVVGRAQLHMLPFHPDKCGGLRPIGRFGLRNQYLLSIVGLNVVFLVIVTVSYLKVPPSLFGLVAGASILYGLLGPIVFMGPLLSFRAAMIRTKETLLSEVAQRLRIELRRLRKELPAGNLLQEDEELIDRLRKVGDVIDELPVWPFDAVTMRRFLTAYGVPMVAAALSSTQILRWALTALQAWLNANS